MEMMISSLLIFVPIVITNVITLLEIFVIFSNRISLEKFFKIRKWLGIFRWLINLIAVIVIFYFKFYEIALFTAGIMLWCAINDIASIFFQKFISKK